MHASCAARMQHSPASYTIKKSEASSPCAFILTEMDRPVSAARALFVFAVGKSSAFDLDLAQSKLSGSSISNN